MGVFGWVFELKLTNRFRIDTYKELADEVNVSHLADGQKENAHFQGGIDGFFFYIQRGSQGYDYKKAVTALNAIKEQIH